ncbi:MULTISPECIES: hypothetical protein [unclassified Streptomyces]|uniref:hypothetical protein n=1 Tax=unclassified Streptomyces TaxID=2593676 RepID=UPI001BEAA26F|nr:MULTISPECIES: hypothetical protein [unclassified Streptomyces]MBT2404178.1 hypothetical protein [Streptomyces sp. ISL-21]MBT2608195.1 hypothetical protein [Streptomyces sp. ISL-87]
MNDEVSGAVPDVPEDRAAEPGEETAAEAAEAAEAAAGPAGPAPLGLVRTPTGHARVDAHLERLADADHLTADGHVEVYEDVHRGLREALTALDAPSLPGPYENRS